MVISQLGERGAVVKEQCRAASKARVVVAQVASAPPATGSVILHEGSLDERDSTRVPADAKVNLHLGRAFFGNV